jgi:cell division topological specificity factor
MTFFTAFRRGSAPIARQRLQILLAHEHAARNQPDLLNILREAILTVVSRHVAFEPDKVQIKFDRGESVTTLVIDIEVPSDPLAPSVAPQGGRAAVPDPARDRSLS